MKFRKPFSKVWGAHKIAEPSHAEESIPEVQDVKARVFNYINQHRSKPISYSEIARGSGTTKSKVGKLVGELVTEGLIEKVSSRPRHGTVYQIIGGGPYSSKVTPEPSIPDGSENEDIDYVKITNDLVWKFMRETRSINVLKFLTWLEVKGKKDA